MASVLFESSSLLLMICLLLTSQHLPFVILRSLLIPIRVLILKQYKFRGTWNSIMDVKSRIKNKNSNLQKHQNSSDFTSKTWIFSFSLKVHHPYPRTLNLVFLKIHKPPRCIRQNVRNSVIQNDARLRKSSQSYIDILHTILYQSRKVPHSVL